MATVILWVVVVIAIIKTRRAIMSIQEKLEEVKASIVAEKEQVATKLKALADEIQALKDIIAGGGSVTEAQLEEIKVAVEGIFVPEPPVEPTP